MPSAVEALCCAGASVYVCFFHLVCNFIGGVATAGRPLLAFTCFTYHGLRPIAAWSRFLYIWLALLIGGGEDLATCCCCLLKPVGVCCCWLLNYHTVFICLPINSFTTVYPFLLDILPFQQGCGSGSDLIRNHIPSWIRIKEGQI